MFGLRAAPDAKYWRHLWSVQLGALSLFFSAVSNVAPILWGGSPFAVDHPFYFAGIVGGLAALGILGRLVDQPDVPNS